jgi:heme-degrading monooxygenase HmoA
MPRSEADFPGAQGKP